MKNQPYIPRTRNLDAVLDAGPASPTDGMAASPAGTGARTSAAEGGAGEAPRVNFTTRLPVDVRRRFKAECTMRGVSMETAVLEALTDWLAA